MAPSTFRAPRVAYDARGLVATHGTRIPVRGVIHSTECGDSPGVADLKGVVAFWQRQGLGYGSELLIDRDGNTALAAELSMICWAVENRNTGTISVELVGFAKFTKANWFLRLKQLRELAKWIAWCNVKYGVPIRYDVETGWSRHADQSRVFGGTHWDPGVGFPLGFVLALAKRYRKRGWK